MPDRYPFQKQGRKARCIDFFCGFGGASYGLQSSEFVEVVAAVDHDPDAISCHRQNHPGTATLNADICEIDPQALAEEFGPIDLVWWSAECTHLSHAKGGEARDADSRMLSFQLPPMARALQPSIIMVENVKEFLSWGPLTQAQATTPAERERWARRKGIGIDAEGKVWKTRGGQREAYLVPDPGRKGETYLKWVNAVRGLGYDYEYRILNAADYGARTSRTRYFGIFARKGLPIRWPRQTHARRSAAPSILNPEPLRTWRPVRPVLDLDNWGKSIFERETPLSVRTIERIAYGLNKFHPSPDGRPYVLELTSPGAGAPPKSAGAAGEGQDLAQYLIRYNRTGEPNSGDQPIGAITTKDRFGLCTCQFVVKQWSGEENSQSIETPLHTITTVPAAQLATVVRRNAFILPYAFNNPPKSTDEPIGTICAKRDQYLCISEIRDVYGTNQVQNKGMHAKIRGGMLVDHRIANIYLRMLTVPELLAAQGFPADYHTPNSATKAKKFIGNSVEPNLVRLLSHAQFGTEEQRCAGVQLPKYTEKAI